MPKVAQYSTTNAESLSLEVLAESIVAPLTSLQLGQNGNSGIFDGGAYYADGSVCTRSLHRKAGFINEPRPLDSTVEMPRIPGSHFYAGMLKNEHFGHFLVESLSRLWAVKRAAEDLQSIVFYARMHRQPVPEWVSALIKILVPDIPLRIVSDPTVFERLVIPDQVAHPYNGYIYGHPATRDSFSSLRQIRGKPLKKLYVSRSKLMDSGGFLGEKRIEEILAREGYSIIHPQAHSLRKQISFYNGAQTLIFAEGAAIHLFALTCRPDQKVFIIQRRKNASVFEWQLRTFGLTPVVGPEAPSSYFIPEHHGRSTLLARARINFEKLRDQMIAEGLVVGVDWDLPDEDLIREEIDRIERHMGQRLLEHPSSSL